MRLVTLQPNSQFFGLILCEIKNIQPIFIDSVSIVTNFWSWKMLKNQSGQYSCFCVNFNYNIHRHSSYQRVVLGFLDKTWKVFAHLRIFSYWPAQKILNWFNSHDLIPSLTICSQSEPLRASKGRFGSLI